MAIFSAWPYFHIFSDGLRANPKNRGDHEHERARECERSQVITRNGPVHFMLHPRVCYDHSTATSSYLEGDALAVVRRTATCV